MCLMPPHCEDWLAACLMPPHCEDWLAAYLMPLHCEDWLAAYLMPPHCEHQLAAGIDQVTVALSITLRSLLTNYYNFFARY